MTVPEDRPPSFHSRGPQGSYSVHPLTALDGVLIYVSLNGETVDYYFGATEEVAATAVATDVLQAVSDAEEGTTR